MSTSSSSTTSTTSTSWNRIVYSDAFHVLSYSSRNTYRTTGRSIGRTKSVLQNTRFVVSSSLTLSSSSETEIDPSTPATATATGAAGAGGAPAATAETVNELKRRLVQTCKSTSSKSASTSEKAVVLSIIQELEQASIDCGIGQASSISGYLSGEWELLFSSTDPTRSSPFFWSFRKAFPDNNNNNNNIKINNFVDSIYNITDSIPFPIKDVGPAYQQIELNGGSTQSGRFVSRVKIGAFNGLATSIMTTRGTIIDFDGDDGIRVRVDTTKPEKSTIVTTLFGPLGDVINENIPPFPSGEALERIVPGSSEVVLRTTYCDDTLRISRNNERYDQEVFVWQRRNFASYEFL